MRQPADRLATENITWGAERIRGELLKLGIKVSKRTIQRYLPPETEPATSPSSQNWGTFLRNHADQIWSCDFTQVHTIFFAPLFVFVIIELSSRRIVHTAVTAHPTDAWVAQQLREATPWGEHPRFLIRDNDSKYGPHFTAVAVGSGIEVIRTPFQAPNASAHIERFFGSLRRECLDHILILSERHLAKVVREYTGFFNHARPHQACPERSRRGIGQHTPVPPKVEPPSTGNVIAFPRSAVSTSTVVAPERSSHSLTGQHLRLRMGSSGAGAPIWRFSAQIASLTGALQRPCLITSRRFQA